MEFKASNQIARAVLVSLAMTLFAFPAKSAGIDAELTDSIQKKDWPSVVLLLEPKKGQNFEHDLILAKALLSLERRQEAQKLLGDMLESRKDERAVKLYQTAGTLFFNQETSNLYYESLELIRSLRFIEAKDHLEQGLVKEPGQLLLLVRLIQVDLVLAKKEAAAANLKLAQASTNGFPELKLFAAKILADTPAAEDEGDAELYRKLTPIRPILLENEVTLPIWGEALKRATRTQDLEALAQSTLKSHPLWTYSLMWLVQSGGLTDASNEKLRSQIEKNLKSQAEFTATLETEMKQSDYLWAGYVTYETLLKQQKTLPTPTPGG